LRGQRDMVIIVSVPIGDRGMELAGSGYLYAVATGAITFAGFSGMTMIFRQILGEHFTRLDSFVVRSVIQLGFMSAFACMLPPLLAQYGIAASIVWRISSAILGIALGLWSFDFPRRRHAASAVRIPAPIWCIVILLDLTVLALSAQAIYPSPTLATGLYSSAASFILMAGALIFLLSLTFLFPVQAAHPSPKDVAPGNDISVS
jgi:hypothetical protein